MRLRHENTDHSLQPADRSEDQARRIEKGHMYMYTLVAKDAGKAAASDEAGCMLYGVCCYGLGLVGVVGVVVICTIGVNGSH